MSFAAGSRRDFGRRDFCCLARILARFAARFAAGFPARILVRFQARSRQDFGRREFRFGENLAGIQAILRRDPAKIPVLILQGNTLSSRYHLNCCNECQRLKYVSAAHILTWYTPGNTSRNVVHVLCNLLCLLNM